MNGRIRLAAALCALVCLLAGCQRYSIAEGPVQAEAVFQPWVPENRSEAQGTSAADVRLQHAGGTYVPSLWMVNSYDGGIAADATRIQPDEAAKGLTAGMWVELPVTFEYGANLRRTDFTLYRMDENGELLPPSAAGDSEGMIPGSLYWYRRMADFTVPETPGRYLCIAEVSFGTDTRYSGSQYVFAFEVSGD